MTKIGFPMLIVCAVGVLAVASLLSRPQAATSIAGSSDKAHATTAVSAATPLELSAMLAKHRMTLVCPDAETHADLTYQRALMPDVFPIAAVDAVQAEKCHLRPVHERDFGQVMHD